MGSGRGDRDYRGLYIGGKKGREHNEREPAVSKSCPVVVAMPKAKQAFYQFLRFRFILVL